MTQNSDEWGYLDQEGSPAEAHAPVPKWLIWVYVILPFFGILWWYLFWNGSGGTWFDRGAWGELQQAAKTTWESTKVP